MNTKANNEPKPRSFTGSMISPLSDQGVEGPAPYISKSFELNSVPQSATIHITAHGLYACFINGQRVGDQVLTPGWTNFDQRLAYQTFDVSDLLQAGENKIDVWLGDGWFRGPIMWPRNRRINTYGTELGALVDLVDEADNLILCSDETWMSGLSPIAKAGIYFGEVFDASQGGAAPSEGVKILSSFNPETLIVQETAGVHELPANEVVSSFSDENGRTIYDFGQNCAGYAQFTVTGDAGAKVILEHAEILDENGVFENSNMRAAEVHIEYVLKGEGEETYKPTFTFQGFRFVRLSIEGIATLKSIKQVPISSAITEAGWVSTGSDLVNGLVNNTKWSQRSNFVDVPTDCPQRDERLGWTGDAQVFAPTACYLFESHSFWKKYLRELMADQRPSGAISHFSPDPTRIKPTEDIAGAGSTGWGDAICVIPMVLYDHFGDKEILSETFDAMVRWTDYLWSISDGPIISPGMNWRDEHFTFGDWLQPKGSSVKPLPTIGDSAAATIYHFIASNLTARAARIIGRDDVAADMERRAGEIKSAFQNEFITPSGRMAYDDQTSYALAIVHDLIPEDKLDAAKDYFIQVMKRTQGKIQTGFIGTPALLPALLKIGEPVLAQHVFLQEDVPGWLYQVKMGATSIWERWDALDPTGKPFDPGMNSYNHYAYGAVCEWIFEALAGIKPDPENPGFANIIFEPTIMPQLAPVEAAHDSKAGRIEANWTLDGEIATYTFEVPEGSTGTLVLNGNNYSEATLDGAALAAADGAISTQVSSGRHTATFRVAAAIVNSLDTSGVTDALPKAGWQSL